MAENKKREDIPLSPEAPEVVELSPEPQESFEILETSGEVRRAVGAVGGRAEQEPRKAEVSDISRQRPEVVLRHLNTLISGIMQARDAESLSTLLADLERESKIFREAGNRQMSLRIAAEAIYKNKHLPGALRDLFPPSNPPGTFEEFQARICEGAKEFRREVLLRLRSDSRAREALGMKSGDAGLKAEASAIFDKVCSRYTLEAQTSVLGTALRESAAENPEDASAEAARQRERMELLRRIRDRLGPEKAGVLSQMPADKRTRMLEIGIQVGLGALWFSGGPALLAWLAKGAFEGVTGIRISEFLSARFDKNKAQQLSALKEKMKQNNLVSAWWKGEESMWTLLKQRIGEWLKLSIPVLGPKLTPPTQIVETRAAEAPEKIIQRACEAIIAEDRTAKQAA